MTVPLLTATVASLALTLVAGYRMRVSLVESTSWVTHTIEVKLAIDECQLALDRGDAVALEKAEATVARLTIDNPRQQRNIAQASLLTERGEHPSLGNLFATMQREEDGLMADRAAAATTARLQTTFIFRCAALLTFVLGIGAFALLRAQRRELENQQFLLETIIESVDEGILAVGTSRRILAMNAAARQLWSGSAPQEEWPEDWRSILRATYEDGSEMLPDKGPLARAMRGETTDAVVCRITPAPGSSTSNAGVWVSASARPIRDRSGETIAAVTTLRDVTEQRASAERLRDQSLTDELTGLLNRRGFLTAATARFDAARKTRSALALLYADINGLKPINDGLGHEQGDCAIRDAARVLRSILRDGDVVSRIGGDEFVAMLPNFAPSARELLLARLSKALRSHAEQERRGYRLSMSADITFVDWDRPNTLDTILADADRKMYERKRQRAATSASNLRVVLSDGRGGGT